MIFEKALVDHIRVYADTNNTFSFSIPGEEIVYQDCIDNALLQLDLLTREIYLPLLCSEQGHASSYGLSADKLMDLLHRLMGGVEVTQGHAHVSNHY